MNPQLFCVITKHFTVNMDNLEAFGAETLIMIAIKIQLSAGSFCLNMFLFCDSAIQKLGNN